MWDALKRFLQNDLVRFSARSWFEDLVEFLSGGFVHRSSAQQSLGFFAGIMRACKFVDCWIGKEIP